MRTHGDGSSPLKKAINLEKYSKKNMAIRLNLWYNIIETKKPKEPITMLRTKSRQLSFYSSLYHRIPKNHILKRINSAISLNFVNNALKNKYCTNFGRPAKEPEMMFKLLFLKKLCNYSAPRLGHINFWSKRRK